MMLITKIFTILQVGNMYRTGDIVCVSYGDFNGDKRVGIFLILYNEKQGKRDPKSLSYFKIVSLVAAGLYLNRKIC